MVRYAAVLVLVGSNLVLGCNSTSKCGETVLTSSPSPGHAEIAKVTTVNCGATSDFFTYVSLHTDRVKLRDDGILFGYKGKAEMSLRWTGDRLLTISCPECEESKIYRQVSKEESYGVAYVLPKAISR